MDYFIAVFPGALMASIFVGMSLPTVNAEIINAAASSTANLTRFLQEFAVTGNNAVYIAGKALIPVGLIFVFILVPLINRKNFGQSLGKRLFKITPIYLSDKRSKEVSFLIRESFIVLPLILLTTISAFASSVPMSQMVVHQQMANIPVDKLTESAKDLVELMPSFVGKYDFLLNIFTNPEYYGVASSQAGL
jgi:uncharacterized RDD family membrane protein YckC